MADQRTLFSGSAVHLHCSGTRRGHPYDLGSKQGVEDGERNHERRRADWDLVRDDVMRKAVWEKFGQNPALADQLLATDDAKLVEHTATDAYWGDGGDGSGRNMLGKILMEVRARLQAA